ncbi:hypothetical protein AGMMS50256_37620 [Betaproteobacteria bacterium]|nr:hypothetical protein AGMMS50256_37620 [Betaproteobacteria bacterium]
MTGTNNYKGNTVVNGGTLKGNISGGNNANLTVNTGATYNSTGALRYLGVLNGTGTIINGNDLVVYNGAFSGTIEGSGNLHKLGSGTTLDLSGTTNNSLGDTVVEGGTLIINSDTNLGNGTNKLIGGTLQLTGSTYSKDWLLEAGADNAIDVFVNDVVMNGILEGDGGFTKEGNGLLILAGNNTYEGDTVINTVGLTVTGTLGYNGSGGNNYAGNIINNATLTFAHAQDGNQTLSGNISESSNSGGDLVKNRAGTLTLTGTNSYTGGTLINGGFINFNNANAFGTGNIVLNGGGLQWADGNTSDISPSSSSIILDPNGGRFDTNGNNVTLANAITSINGNGALTKQGEGMLTLGGINNYTGNTTVSKGTLGITGTLGSGTTTGSTVNVVGNAALSLDSSAALTALPASLTAQTVNFETNSTLALSGINNSIMSGSGGVNFANNTNLIANLTGTADGDTVLMVDTFNLDTNGKLQVNALVPTGTTGRTFVLVDTGTGVNFAGKCTGQVNGSATGLNGPNVRYGGNEYDDASEIGKLKLTVFADDINRIAVWTGTDGLWWNETSKNWDLGGTPPATYQGFFKNGDTVVFGDIGAGSVNVDANLTTGDVTFTILPEKITHSPATVSAVPEHSPKTVTA